MIITNSPLLSRLFIYKDPGWTRAHPLGGGGRREELLSWDKDTTDTTEIINWLSRASLAGRDERERGLRVEMLMRSGGVVSSEQLIPHLSNLISELGQVLTWLNLQKIFSIKTSSKYCCADQSAEERQNLIIIVNFLMSYFELLILLIFQLSNLYWSNQT